MSVFVIAEIGINHNGDMSIVKKLIDVAAGAAPATDEACCAICAADADEAEPREGTERHNKSFEVERNTTICPSPKIEYPWHSIGLAISFRMRL